MLSNAVQRLLFNDVLSASDMALRNIKLHMIILSLIVVSKTISASKRRDLRKSPTKMQSASATHSTTSFYYCLYNTIDQDYHTPLIHVAACRFLGMCTSYMSSGTVPMIGSYIRSQHTTCCCNGVIDTEHFFQLAPESFCHTETR